MTVAGRPAAWDGSSLDSATIPAEPTPIEAPNTFELRHRRSAPATGPASRIRLTCQPRLSNPAAYRHGGDDGRQHRARHQLLGDVSEIPFAGPGCLRGRLPLGALS